MGSAHLSRSRRNADHYDILGVPSAATFREIEQAYWQAAKTRRDLLPQLNEAYEILSDANRRGAYDRQRVVSSEAPPKPTDSGPLRPNPDRNKLRWYLQ